MDTTSPHAGAAHLTHRVAAPYQGTTYTIPSDLGNGLYTVKARVRGSGDQTL